MPSKALKKYFRIKKYLVLRSTNLSGVELKAHNLRLQLGFNVALIHNSD